MKRLFLTSLATASIVIAIAPSAMADNSHNDQLGQAQYQTRNSDDNRKWDNTRRNSRHDTRKDNYNGNRNNNNDLGWQNQTTQGQWQSVNRNDKDYRWDNNRKYSNQRYQQYPNVGYQTHDYNQLPPGIQKKVARGQGVPPGWAKKLRTNEYTVVNQGGREVYILDRDVYNRATVVGRPRAGVVQLRVDNRTLEVIELSRAILNILY